MGSFPAPLSAPQLATLRRSNYWIRVLTAINPSEVVFRAQSSQTITNDAFITFTWDNADVGAYTDVWEGMVCYLSSSTDIRDAFYRGRVRLSPSATEFYINKNPSTLADGTYIIVTRDTDLFVRVRDDTLVDGSIAYHALPPVLMGLPSTFVLYDSDNDGQVTVTPAQTGIPVDAAATMIDTWAWDVSGSGAFSIDDPTLEHPTFTLEAGFHYLIRVIYTDDNGVSNYQIVQVYAIDRTFSAPVVQPVISGSVNGTLDDGWTASLTAYADVSTLIDRSHCVIFGIERFGDNSHTPMFDNVLMSGRIRSDSLQTEGSIEAGRVAQVTFSVEGVTSYLRRLRIPNDIVRATDTPNAWGEITEPNPFRMAVYEMWAYSTLTNIGSFGVESGAFAAWQIGGEPRGIDGGFALDVLIGILDPIKAYPNVAPTGDIFLARTVSYLADRSGVQTIATLALGDLRTYTVDRDSSDTVAQVIAFAGSFDSTANTFVLYTAQAPTIPYGDGGDTRELDREILAADSTILAAQEEVASRAANEFAYQNPKPLLKATIFDSWALVLRPTNYQRWAAVLPADSNTLAIPYGASDYWQLQSVSLTINDNGSIDATAEWPAETQFSDAQVRAAPLPLNVGPMNPVLPDLPNDLLLPTDPLEIYPTDDFPTLEDRQAIDPFSGMQAYTPLPPDVAAQAAANMGQAGCVTVRSNWRVSVNAESGPVTTLSAPYLLSVQGKTRYSTTEWQHTINFLAEDGGFVRDPDPLRGNGMYGHWVSGQGWLTDDAFASGNYRRGVNIVLTLSSTPFTYLQVKFDYAGIPFVPPGSSANVAILDATPVYNVFDTSIAHGTDLYQAWTGSATATQIVLGLNASVNNGAAVYGGSARLKELTLRGTGTNPFTGGTPQVLEGDAFYVYSPTDDTINPTLYSSTEGYIVDNTKYAAIPPYSASHKYDNLPYTGTGNKLFARMDFDDHSTKDNAFLFSTACPKG